MMDAKQRKAIYGVVAAIVALLAVYGVVTQSEAAAWLSLAAAVINGAALWMARSNVPSDEYDGDGSDDE